MLKGMFAVLTGTCISVATFAQERDIRREEIIIRKFEKPALAFLGVNLEKAENGVRIVSVAEASAAEKAGLKEGDVIVSVNGAKETDPAAFRERILSFKPEEQVQLVVLPKGEKKEKTISIKLGSQTLPNSFRMMIPGSPDAPMGPGAPRIRMFRNGEALGPIIEEEIQRSFSWQGDRPQLGIRIQDTEAANGVTVLDVNEGSPAQKAGIKTDDLITAIDGKEIKDTDEAREALQTVREKSTYSLKLKREGKTMEMQVQIPKKLKKATL